MDIRPETLRHQYQLRFSDLAVYRSAVWRTLCTDFFAEWISPTDSVLDLGAGWGEFINNITVKRRWAMDLNPETGARVDRGITFLQQDCSTIWPLDNDSLDVVFTSNFLEHLPDKESVERTIREVHRCLKSNGILICVGPNIKYLPGAYWDFWDHHVPLTERSLGELLTMSGFAIDRCVSRFLPYTMSTGRTPPLFLARLYLKIPLLWPFLGKQFLLVARKHASEA